jgi:hypothetical protein
VTFPLFYLTDVAYGGFATYTAHLIMALRAEGKQPQLFKIGKKIEKMSRKFTHGTHYQNIPIEAATAIVKRHGGLITCCYWKTDPEAAEALLKAGCAIVIHDPTELTPELVTALKKHQPRVIAIRTTNVQPFRERGLEHVTFVQHPYVRVAPTNAVKRTRRAVTTCRVDFDKHTDEIVQANDMVPREKQIEIFGQVNRLYAFHKLAKAYPQWETYYKGAFPKEADAAYKLLRTSELAVDMSRISGDGGGTQYSFLEAWDAGAALVVHDGWIMPGGVLVPGHNCLSVASPEELSDVLTGDQSLERVIFGGECSLDAHAPSVVVPLLIEALRPTSP